MPAPLDELPLMVRAGAVLPLLPPEVDTLADVGDSPSFVTLAERERRIDLMAFPRGRSVQRLVVGTGAPEERIVSEELPGRRWRLSFEMRRGRSVALAATLNTLRRPFRPCRVLLGRSELSSRRWRYDADTGVLRARFTTRGRPLTVEGNCAAAAGRRGGRAPSLTG